MVVPYLQKEEIEELLHSISNVRDNLVVRLLYESGCAVSDITELKASAVHPDGIVTFSDRKSVISAELANALLQQASIYVFSSRQTPTITPKRIQQIIKPYLAPFRKGKETPHLLRYSHIIHAYKQGLQLQSICEQTGLSVQRLSQIIEGLPPQKGYGSFFASKGGKQ